jgi:hypothetical protein
MPVISSKMEAISSKKWRILALKMAAIISKNGGYQL